MNIYIPQGENQYPENPVAPYIVYNEYGAAQIINDGSTQATFSELPGGGGSGNAPVLVRRDGIILHENAGDQYIFASVEAGNYKIIVKMFPTEPESVSVRHFFNTAAFDCLFFPGGYMRAEEPFFLWSYGVQAFGFSLHGAEAQGCYYPENQKYHLMFMLERLLPDGSPYGQPELSLEFTVIPLDTKKDGDWILPFPYVPDADWDYLAGGVW